VFYRSHRKVIRAAGLLLILAAVLLTAIDYIQYTDYGYIFPPGTTWGGVEVGGLTRGEASARVQVAYNRPLELRYQEATFQVTRKELGLRVNILEEYSSASLSFWDYLWNRSKTASEIPLDIEVDRDKLRAFLVEQVASRYDCVPAEPLPLAGSTRFEIGQPGNQLDVEASLKIIAVQIRSLDIDRIDLVVKDLPPAKPSLENLEIFLKQKIDQAGFDGIVEIALTDLRDDRQLQLAYRAGQDLGENIAFSAASTIKIPILVSVLRRVAEPVPQEVDSLIVRMITLSENPPADQLMEQVIGGEMAPLRVNEDLIRLGLENTFLAGYFYLGAPLLRLYDTPANLRQDVNTSPDIYNQTTAGDMRVLLEAIYQCAHSNRGLLVDTFPGEMTQSKCEYLLGVMAQNKIGVLFEAGVPDGTRVAHKHGWIEESDGYLHLISDAGVIYGDETDYLLIAFLYDANQLLFDPANALMAQLSQVVYNYFNPNNQIDWLFAPVKYH